MLLVNILVYGPGKFPLRIRQDSTQDVTAGWRGDGEDEGAGDDGDGDDDPDEVQLDGDDDGDDLPSLERNFPGRFLPARELFSLGVFRPAEAVESISDSPLGLRFSRTTIYARGRWQEWAALFGFFSGFLFVVAVVLLPLLPAGLQWRQRESLWGAGSGAEMEAARDVSPLWCSSTAPYGHRNMLFLSSV
jgi:hypothetical protein